MMISGNNKVRLTFQGSGQISIVRRIVLDLVNPRTGNDNVTDPD